MNKINTIKPKPGTKIRVITYEYGLNKGSKGVVLEPGEFENCFVGEEPEFTANFENGGGGEWYLPIADKDVRWEVIA